MTAAQTYYPFTGGLDQESPAIAIPPGRAISVMNHECVGSGYQRVQGFERFDGHPAPSQATFHVGTFINGSDEILVGDDVEGAVTGCTARVLAVILTDGAWIDGDATGTIVFENQIGDWTTTEHILRGVDEIADIGVPPVSGHRLDSADAMTWWQTAVANRRAEIEKPPGTGPVRGVLWYEGKLHAWRDRELVDEDDPGEGILYRSTPTGWQAVDLGFRLNFTAGGPGVIAAGQTITGDTSGATATVRYVSVTSTTDWSDGNAAGVLIVENIVGDFVQETISTDTDAFVASISGVQTAVQFAPGGRYEFVLHNFYGSTGFERAYGVNGMGRAFSFDGDSVIFIDTGMEDDRPFLIAEHKNHLFLGFPRGSLQFSSLGEPLEWNALTGAAEIGMGKELTGLVSNSTASLIVTTGFSTAVLSGNDSSDFLLDVFSDEAGAKRFSAQRIGQVLYMDERGIRSVTATQTYGNFKLGTFTSLIQKTLEAYRRNNVQPVASIVVKGKDQYLLFYADGTGISLFMGRKNPEAMIFNYPFTVTSIDIAEVEGIERLFVGTADGWVLELNVGTSFDGEEIESFIQMPFAHQGAPRALKRYHKAVLEMVALPGSQIAVVAQFDYGAGLQPYAHDDIFDIDGGGGFWGMSNYAEFFWTAPTVASAEAYLQGLGANISLVIYAKSAIMESYILQGVTLAYSVRGTKR